MRTLRWIAIAAALAAVTAGGTQPRVRAVVDAESGYLLGGTVDGAWRDARAMSRLLRGGERYRVYAGGRLAGEATGGRAASIDEPCPETFAVELSPAREDGIAVSGAANALPRPVARLDPASPVYREAVRQILLRNGIRRPEVRITGLLRADLDGDGRDEVIASATRGRSDVGIRVAGGDYSMLFVRTVVGGAVRTVMLEEEYHPRASDTSTLNAYTIAGVLDLDGDGTMEVIARGRYYEGAWTTVQRVRAGRKQELATAGCGV